MAKYLLRHLLKLGIFAQTKFYPTIILLITVVMKSSIYYVLTVESKIDKYYFVDVLLLRCMAKFLDMFNQKIKININFSILIIKYYVELNNILIIYKIIKRILY